MQLTQYACTDSRTHRRCPGIYAALFGALLAFALIAVGGLMLLPRSAEALTPGDMLTEEFPDPAFAQYVWNTVLGQGGTPASDYALTDANVATIQATTSISITMTGTSYTSLEGVKNFSNLQTLTLYKGTINALDVSGMSALQSVTSYDGGLITLDCSDCSALKNLRCDENALETLNVDGCNALTVIVCERNNLATLDLSGFTALTDIYARDNELVVLNVQGCSSLLALECGGNALSELDISASMQLGHLMVGGNHLPVIDLSATNNILYALNYEYEPTGIFVKRQTTSLEAQAQADGSVVLDLSPWLPYLSDVSASGTGVWDETSGTVTWDELEARSDLSLSYSYLQSNTADQEALEVDATVTVNPYEPEPSPETPPVPDENPSDSDTANNNNGATNSATILPATGDNSVSIKQAATLLGSSLLILLTASLIYRAKRS